MTPTPEETGDAEFWRLTHEALRRHPEALKEDPVWERTLRDGLEEDSDLRKYVSDQR